MISCNPAPPVTARAPGLTAVYCREAPLDAIPELQQGPRIELGDRPPAIHIAPPGPPGHHFSDALFLVIDDDRVPGVAAIPERQSVDPFLYGIAHTLLCGFRRDIAPPERFLQSLAGPIAQHVRDFYSRPAAQRRVQGLSPARLARALEHLENHLAEPCSIEELADLVHLSPFHFCRMFRRSTGRSPHAFLTDRRIARARHLLEDTDLPIVEIARRVGFGTQSHFTTTFRQATGSAPGAYRLRAKPASISATRS